MRHKAWGGSGPAHGNAPPIGLRPVSAGRERARELTPDQLHPSANWIKKHWKSLTLSTGTVVLLSQLA